MGNTLEGNVAVVTGGTFGVGPGFEIGPLFKLLSRVLTPGGAFVFSVTHPCFHSAAVQRFAEIYDEQGGRHGIRSGVKVSSYLSPSARKTEGIVGQPEPQWFFHRSISTLFGFGFEVGFVVDGIEEPRLPVAKQPEAGVRWHDSRTSRRSWLYG